MNAGKPLEDLTYKVIGAAMSVHNALGPGLKESAYQKALSLEMEKAGLSFEAEQAVTVSLDGSQVGRLYLDHLVEGQLVVEEKALSHLLTQEEYKRIFPPKNVARYRERINRYVAKPRQAVSVNPLPIR